MQPPAAPRYRKLFSTLRGKSTLFSQLTIMSLRHILRRPVRAGATSLGIAMGLGLLVTALLSFNSVEHMIDIAFFRTDRQHATLTFTDEKHARALQSVERMPGVMRAEPYRSVAVRLRNGHLSRQLSIIGKPKDMDLSRVLDLDDRAIDAAAGRARDQRAGGTDPEPAARRRRRGRRSRGAARGTRQLPVADVIKSYFGLTAFMDIDALDQVMYGPRLTGVHIAYDMQKQDALFTAIKSTPSIGSIALQRHALTRFRETIAQNINYSVTIYVTLAVIIAFGVVYNSARIQLSEHARELASLQGAGLYARGGLARAAHGTHRAHAGCDPSWMDHRLRLRLAADQGVFERPLSSALRYRKRNLRQGGARRARSDGGLRPHRSPAC